MSIKSESRIWSVYFQIIKLGMMFEQGLMEESCSWAPGFYILVFEQISTWLLRHFVNETETNVRG